MFSFPPEQKELRLQHGLNRWPAKRAQKVKGTHTVSLKREKSIFVSSALNAYQAIDILLLKSLEKAKSRRQDRLLLWNLSCRRPLTYIWFNHPVGSKRRTWIWNYKAYFISTIPSFTLLFNCHIIEYCRGNTLSVSCRRPLLANIISIPHLLQVILIFPSASGHP